MKNAKILIAEDVRMNMIMVKAMLSTIVPGATIIEAENGIVAVELTALHQPDLILMDVQMPLMDGIEATKMIRNTESGKDIPIIALTAGVLLDEQEKCTAAGMNEITTKPINPDNFRMLILRYADK